MGRSGRADQEILEHFHDPGGTMLAAVAGAAMCDLRCRLDCHDGQDSGFRLGLLPLGYFFFQLFVRANEVRHSFDDAFLKYLVRSAQRIVRFFCDRVALLLLQARRQNQRALSHSRWRPPPVPLQRLSPRIFRSP